MLIAIHRMQKCNPVAVFTWYCVKHIESESPGAPRFALHGVCRDQLAAAAHGSHDNVRPLSKKTAWSRVQCTCLENGLKVEHQPVPGGQLAARRPCNQPPALGRPLHITSGQGTGDGSGARLNRNSTAHHGWGVGGGSGAPLNRNSTVRQGWGWVREIAIALCIKATGWVRGAAE
jgi:hypothetical protein